MNIVGSGHPTEHGRWFDEFSMQHTAPVTVH